MEGNPTATGRGRGAGRGRHRAAGGREMAGIGGQMETLTLENSKKKKTYEIAKRKGYGTNGEMIGLWTNWFQIRLSKDGKPLKLRIQQYQVDVKGRMIGEGKRENEKERKQHIFWHCVQQNPTVFSNKFGIVYDDSNLVYTTERLPLRNARGERDQQRFDFDFQFERDNRARLCSVDLQWTDEFDLDESCIIRGADFSSRNTAPMQCLDLIFTQNRRYPLEEFGKNFYTLGNQRQRVMEIPSVSERQMAIDSVLEIWRGLITATSAGTKHGRDGGNEGSMPLVNIDLAHAVFMKPIPLDCLWRTFTPERDPRDNRPLRDFEVHRISGRFKGLKFETMHQPGRRVHVCNGIGRPSAEIHFEHNGEMISMVEYYRRVYNRVIQQPQLPTVTSGRDGKAAFPMEFCRLDRPQKAAMKFTENERVRQEMIKKTRLDAPERKKKIEEMAVEANLRAPPGQTTDDPFRQSFGVQMQRDMVHLDGRVLQPPAIVSQDNRNVRNGQWSLENGHFLIPAQLHEYAVISFLGDRDFTHDNFGEFFRLMRTYCRQKGMLFPDNIDAGKFLRIPPQDRMEEIAGKFESLCRKGATPQIVFVFVNGKDNDRYAAIKLTGDKTLGIVSQVIQLKTARKVLEEVRNSKSATLGQLVLKVNSKLGGKNYATDNTGTNDDGRLWRILTSPTEPTLFLGIDVTHPGAGGRELFSIAAVVGNIDFEATRFGVSFQVQKQFKEQLVYFEQQIRERLLHFYRETGGQRPARLIILRDGIGNSQFEEALNTEVSWIESACRSIDPTQQLFPCPKITYIVVQKRHHTRFFPDTEMKWPEAAWIEQPRRINNVPPGTTIDTTITHSVNNDYYTCSHLAPVGTARPAHYSILHDENNFTPDDVQALTYRLCHLNQRCTKAGSIPAPVFYADLACTRATFYLRARGISDSLSSTDARRQQELPEQDELTQFLKTHPDLTSMFWI